MEGLPDVVATFDPDEVRTSWEDDATGVVVGHLDFRGQPYTVSARFALQRAIAAWAELGYAPKVGIELEAYVLQPDGEGGWERWKTPRSFVYGTGRSADPTGLIDDSPHCLEMLEVSPLEPSINASTTSPQFELTIEYDDAPFKGSDEAYTYSGCWPGRWLWPTAWTSRFWASRSWGWPGVESM